MTKDGRVAKRYAQALLGAAKNSGISDAVESDLVLIGRVADADPRVHDFIVAPFATREEKRGVFERVFGDKITALTHHILQIMLEKGREDVILDLLPAYQEMRRLDEGIVSVFVTTAVDLPADQRERLERGLATRLGRRIEAAYDVDSHLMGGIRVAYESFVLDGSARGTLAGLRERLKYDLLKLN